MRPYPSYKDSGVEWIGEIPYHWDTIKCGYLFKVKSIKNTKNEVNLSVYRDYGVILRDSRDDNYNRVSEDTSSYKLVEIGDFVFNKMKCWMGSLGVSEYRGIVSPSYTVCETTREFDRKYIHYLLRSTYYIQEYEKHSYGVRIGQWELHFHDFKNIFSFFPPLTEQKQIVSFLDHKTQKIDELIEKTEKKIELLKEKRTALINHCVTKGLNPEVELKDSGIEWIGEIPSHWGVIRLKYFNEVYSSSVDRYVYEDELQVSVCHYPDVYNNEFINEDIKLNKGSCSYVEFERFQLKKGLVIITKDSESPDDIGIPCYVETNLKNVVCGYHLSIIYKSKDYISSKFLFRFIQSDIVRCHFEVHSKGITRFGLGKSIIENLFVNLPPLSEQHQIVEYLDEQTNKIDTTIEKETNRIELLKEYRQSLISEVVMGKIDVRGWNMEENME